MGVQPAPLFAREFELAAVRGCSPVLAPDAPGRILLDGDGESASLSAGATSLIGHIHRA